MGRGGAERILYGSPPGLSVRRTPPAEPLRHDYGDGLIVEIDDFAVTVGDVTVDLATDERAILRGLVAASDDVERGWPGLVGYKPLYDLISGAPPIEDALAIREVYGYLVGPRGAARRLAEKLAQAQDRSRPWLGCTHEPGAGFRLRVLEP